jgi:drug/metabolite transporter (DMT)-like permease
MVAPWQGLELVLGCSVAWSGLDLLRKRLMGAGIAPTPLLVVLAAGQMPVLGVWATMHPGHHFDAGYLLPGLASVALNILANLAFLEAMRIARLSLTVPLLSLTPVFTTLVAIPILGQVPSGRQVAGIALVVAGALLLHAGGVGEGAGFCRRALRERGSLLMLGVALAWSLTMPLDRLALDSASPPIHALALNGGVALGALGVLASRGRLRELGAVRRIPGLLALTLLVAASAVGLQLLAILEVPVGLVETIKRGFGSTLALLFGHLAFHEPLTARGALAVLVMTGGVALILL